MMGNQHEIMTKNKGIVYGSFFLVFFAFTSVRVVPPATIGVVALFGKCVLQPATLLRALSYSEYPYYVLQYYFNGTLEVIHMHLAAHVHPHIWMLSLIATLQPRFSLSHV